MTKYFLELRNRLFFIFTSYFSTILVTYFYKETLLFSLVNPNVIFGQTSFFTPYFIFTNVTEIFSIYMQLIFFLSFQLMVLFFIYHLFIFFSPAFFKIEYINLKIILKTMLVIWLISVIASNYVIIPLTWNFFLSFQELITTTSFNIYFEAKLSEYLNFYITLYYLCGLYFEIFILLFLLLSHINIKKNNAKKFRKLYYFSFVFFSTLISPPDILSQILISSLLILSYEVMFFLFVLKNNFN